MANYKTLASMDFASKLYEAKLQTQTGKALVSKYQAYCISNPVSCALVNNFMKEAKDCIYDSGIAQIYESLANVISENKYSWAIASTCESIDANETKGNYLNRRAAQQVAPLLEMSERDVVDYIKSGAFKSVMHVEQFRNIAKSIFRDQPVVESNSQFKLTHPISVIEQKEGVVYFEVLGDIYKIDEGKIEESKAEEVSQDFIVMSQLLESNNISLVDDSLVLTVGNRKYTVKEQGACVLKANDRDLYMTVDQLRENSNTFVSTSFISQRNNYAFILESFAKIVENYDKIGILNNVSVVNTANDKFLVIENDGNAYAKMLQTTHTPAWKVVDNIAEACKVIKKNTRVDLSENYKVSIDKVVEQVSEQEAKQITESIESEKMNSRKQKIAELTERYKNDPVRLHMLSQIAADLSEME